jgi:hypothetical protein
VIEYQDHANECRKLAAPMMGLEDKEFIGETCPSVGKDHKAAQARFN